MLTNYYTYTATKKLLQNGNASKSITYFNYYYLVSSNENRYPLLLYYKKIDISR